MEFEGIGIGISDFKALRLRKNYFIDKTMFIKDIIDNQASVALITRPRRFGKTLNMSMLRYFFDCDVKDAKELFEGLKIMEQGEKYTSKLGAYPCIYLNLKDICALNYEEMIIRLRGVIKKVYKEHSYLLDSDKLYKFEKEKIMEILNESEDDFILMESIRELIRDLYIHYEKLVMIFVDDYDMPIQKAYEENYYNETYTFFQRFYMTFKDNPYLEKVVLTGLSKITQTSIFSGLNNIILYTVLDNEFADDFGITSEEMDKVIEDFSVEDDKKEIKRWYDGYRIGNVEGIYNPWSILNYLTDKQLKPYWVNTSSNDLIKRTLKKSTTVKEKMERLLKGEAIEIQINLETIIVGIEENENNIWCLMLGTGYLKVDEIVDLARGIYKVKLPNYEIKLLFENIVKEWFANKVIGNDLNSILKDLVELNLDEFEIKFRKLVEEMFSYMDVVENTAENFYHAFVLGMLVGLKDSYYVNSNRESGMGRYDIMLEPHDKSKNSFIIEFKVANDMQENTIEDVIENAKKQIEERDYESNLRERGFNNITKMVFAFKGKECRMKVV